MNAAAKVIHQSNLFSGHLSDIRLSKKLYIRLFLMFGVLLSALAIVYMTNLHRMRFSQLEHAEQVAQQLQLQWGQLLLERASLATPARVQQLASEKLGMILPENKQVIMQRVQ
ncbi:MAG: cell division protein FtsL [Legionella sp.]